MPRRAQSREGAPAGEFEHLGHFSELSLLARHTPRQDILRALGLC